MTQTRLLQLQTERGALLRMLARIPAEDVLDRGSLQARLDDIDAEMASLPMTRAPARAQLTFRGRPVVGSHGIVAEFGMEAVNAFSEAVAAVAASLTAPLKAMGPIPKRGQNQLLITGTAIGSFGFQLEEVLPDQMPLAEATIVEQALEKTQNLLIATTKSDDELADSASELDQRALNKVRDFVEKLAANEATCGLKFGSEYFRFESSTQVRKSLERLSDNNILEETQHLRGHFEGVLPNKRKSFEFFHAEANEVIVGKIGPAVEHPERINERLKEACVITVVVTRVGAGKPRYLLKTGPEWTVDMISIPAAPRMIPDDEVRQAGPDAES